MLLAFDISNSMKAKDVTPSRLGAAQRAAAGFVDEQPDSVDVGVVVFGDVIRVSPETLALQAAGIAALVAGVILAAIKVFVNNESNQIKGPTTG